MQRWLTENSIYPTWLPRELQRWHVLALITLALQVIATGLTGLILLAIPTFGFRGALLIIGASLASHLWGFVPGTLASFLGAAFIDYFLTPPYFTVSLTRSADIAATLFYLAVCLATAWLARVKQ